ncbi:MAG TPA: cell wall-binding repeat-containing protein, partial [Egibacteraceae bacterium]|nr:cell wall-binding repeat-containing protein [Egibacteraceae bacterium]
PTPEPTPEPEPVVRIGDSPDIVRGAVQTSQAVFPEAGSATLALLARDDAFADSLAGSALARELGPILYTTGGPDGGLRSETARELQRVLAPGSTVTVLGGPAAVSDGALQQVRALGFAVRRLAGASRVETALAVADAVTSHPDRVLLANGWNWADAVTGGAYAAAERIPVLVTPSGGLADPVAGYLAAHRPRVLLLGGRVALSDAVAQAVGPDATRVAGATRAGTAVEIARQLWGRSVATADDVWVLEDGYAGDSWAPALAAAALSASHGAPQLLVQGSTMPPETEGYLRELGYEPEAPGTAFLVGPLVDSSLIDVVEGLLGQ